MILLHYIYEILKSSYLLLFEMGPYLMLGLFFVAVLNFFFTKDIIIKYVGKDDFWSVLKASLFGVPLPLCSCGVIPTSAYLSKNGASRGAVVSFLISTPQTGIDSIIATYGMLGWVFAIFRPLVALISGVVGGTLIKYVKPEKEYIESTAASCEIEPPETVDKWQKAQNSIKYAFYNFLDDIAVQFLVGILIGGLISFFIPEKFFENSPVSNGLLGMLLMIAIGAPMYICATASIPIAVTLMMKGFSPGVAFVFLAVGPVTNAASFAILMKTLGKKTTISYVAIVSVLAIIFGYILDAVYNLAGFDNMAFLKMQHHHMHTVDSNPVMFIISIAFQMLFFIIITKKLIAKFKHITKKDNTMEQENYNKITIKGMECNHCVMNVTNAAKKVNGVEDIKVSLSDSSALIQGDYDFEELKKAIEEMGYTVQK